MKLSRAQTIALGVLVAIAAFVVFLSTRSDQPPVLPLDPEHVRWEGPEPCMTCHDRGGILPQTANHPLGRDCLRCHGIPKE